MLTLRAEARGLTKSARTAARRQGFVPAVVYGKDVPATPIRVPESELREALKNGGRHRLIRLSGPGLDRPRMVLIKDLQIDNLRSALVHVDFFEPVAGKPIHVRVPVVVQGDEVLTLRGLVMERHVAEVDCLCLPEDVPEAIYVDVSRLRPGEQIFLGELEAPPGVKVTGSRDAVVITVEAPMATMIPGEGAVAVTAGE